MNPSSARIKGNRSGLAKRAINKFRKPKANRTNSKKSGNSYFKKVAKEYNLTKSETIKLSEIIHKEKKSVGRGGADNLDLDTIRSYADEIISYRK